MNNQLKESACDHLMQLCIHFQQIIFRLTETEMKLHTLNIHLQWNANGRILIEFPNEKVFFFVQKPRI